MAKTSTFLPLVSGDIPFNTFHVLEIWSFHPWIAGHESSGSWPIGITVDFANCDSQNAFVEILGLIILVRWLETEVLEVTSLRDLACTWMPDAF